MLSNGEKEIGEKYVGLVKGILQEPGHRALLTVMCKERVVYQSSRYLVQRDVGSKLGRELISNAELYDWYSKLASLGLVIGDFRWGDKDPEVTSLGRLVNANLVEQESHSQTQ